MSCANPHAASQAIHMHCVAVIIRSSVLVDMLLRAMVPVARMGGAGSNSPKFLQLSSKESNEYFKTVWVRTGKPSSTPLPRHDVRIRLSVLGLDLAKGY